MSGFTTKTLHTGYKRNKHDGAVIPPLHLTTTFEFGNEGGFDYSRTVNPTRILLEETISALDENKYGLAYSSGSSALANIVALLKPGENILFSTDAYGGTYRFIVNVAGKQGIGYEIVDLTDLKKTEEVLKKNSVKIVWVETPTNPLLKVTDIKELATLVHSYNALLVVDNTFATPFIQQPATLGADIVAYSTTKYINGHSDSVGGALTLSDTELYKQLKFLQNAIGAILSPFDSWLTLRGLRTLELRMLRHCENGKYIANFLVNHPKVKQVWYPGLFTGSQGAIVKKQMKFAGGMLSVELKPEYDVQKFIQGLHYFPLAESLGGVESLIDHPATMTHGSIPKIEREKIGLTDGLFRISVGIENKEDLIQDLKLALKKA
ncbi:MAG: PLP-dependent aspartate aminotransferase family protein [Candidatus Roizmanbacteria bacterium]